MKKFRMMFSALLVVFAITSLCVPALAYTDGDREVLYYNFNITESIATSSNNMKRLYDRQWVVTVTDRANNRYPITYGIIDNNATMWLDALVMPSLRREDGKGNFGASYYDTSSIGRYLYLSALIDDRDHDMGVRTWGQWSTDAANFN